MSQLIKYSDIRKKLRIELQLDGFGILSHMLESRNIKSVKFEPNSDHSILATAEFFDGGTNRVKVWWTLESKKVDMDVLLWYATTMAFISEPSVIRTDFATYEVLD